MSNQDDEDFPTLSDLRGQSTDVQENFDEDDCFTTLSDLRDSETEEKSQSTDVLENFDVEFEVEGKLLKANKYCLSMISPVFKVMFKGEFREKEETIIPYREKHMMPCWNSLKLPILVKH